MLEPRLNIDYSNLPEISCPVCASRSYLRVTLRFDSGRLVRCSDCNHIYLNPTLTDEMLTAIYEQYHISDSDRSLMNTIEAWFADPKGPYQFALSAIERGGGLSGKRVLEVGCGPGRFLHECQAHGALVTGIDISPGAVRLAKHYFNLDLLPKTLDQAIADGDVSKSKFDFVFTFETIEHVPKPGEFLQAIQWLLAPGGRLIISTPNFGLFYLIGSAASVVSQWPEHLHFFDPPSLLSLLQRQKWDFVDVTTVNPQTFAGRQKQVLIRRRLVRGAWERLRRFRAIYYLKDVVFRLLDRYRETPDVKAWNGTSLVALSRKPIA